MDAVWIVLLVAAAGYLTSLHLRPYTRCRACRSTPGRRHGAVLTYTFAKCPRCAGRGRRLRLGARVLLGRTEEK